MGEELNKHHKDDHHCYANDWRKPMGILEKGKDEYSFYTRGCILCGGGKQRTNEGHGCGENILYYGENAQTDDTNNFRIQREIEDELYYKED